MEVMVYGLLLIVKQNPSFPYMFQAYVINSQAVIS